MVLFILAVIWAAVLLPPYLQNRSELRGMGNTLRVVVENEKGDIFDARYLDALKHINDDLFLTAAPPPPPRWLSPPVACLGSGPASGAGTWCSPWLSLPP